MSALHRSMQGIGRPADRPIDHPCAPSLRGGHTQPFVRQRQSRLRRETSTASVHPTPSREVARGIDRETACHADSRRLTPTHADSRRLTPTLVASGPPPMLATPRVLRGRSPERSSTPPRPLLDPSSTPPRPRPRPIRTSARPSAIRPIPLRRMLAPRSRTLPRSRPNPPLAATSRHEPPRAATSEHPPSESPHRGSCPARPRLIDRPRTPRPIATDTFP